MDKTIFYFLVAPLILQNLLLYNGAYSDNDTTANQTHDTGSATTGPTVPVNLTVTTTPTTVTTSSKLPTTVSSASVTTSSKPPTTVSSASVTTSSKPPITEPHATTISEYSTTGSSSNSSTATPTTTPPCPKQSFDGASFVGGIVLGIGLCVIFCFVYNWYNKKKHVGGPPYQQF